MEIRIKWENWKNMGIIENGERKENDNIRKFRESSVE